MSNWVILGIVALVIAIGLWARTGAGRGYETLAMTVEQMQAEGALIVDIRTPQEWKDTGVIQGARLVTFQDADGFVQALGKDLADGRPLVLVCRSGSRSSAAAAALVGKIPNRIISAKGGMSSLITAGYQTVRPSK